MIPRLVPEDRLQAGNAIIQGTSQLSLFIGPVLAGILITLPGGERGRGGRRCPRRRDSVSCSGWTRWGSWSRPSRSRCSRCLRWRQRGLPGRGAQRGVPVAGGGSRARLAGQDSAPLLRAHRGVNLALLGPLAVGLPVLAHSRFGGGALAYGGILSGLGLGALVGLAAGGLLRRPRVARSPGHAGIVCRCWVWAWRLWGCFRRRGWPRWRPSSWGWRRATSSWSSSPGCSCALPARARADDEHPAVRVGGHGAGVEPGGRGAHGAERPVGHGGSGRSHCGRGGRGGLQSGSLEIAL